MMHITGSAIGRERCDSLPSRNRTTSETIHQNLSMPPPPPRMPTGLNRPHSMYNRHSNSPPLNAGPLSPSTGCSESDGSSLSIDETDGYSHSITPDEGHNFGSRYFKYVACDYRTISNDIATYKSVSLFASSSRTSGAVIPEENPDEWLENNKRNVESTPNGTLSLPIQSSQAAGPRKGSPAPPLAYMEMYSPCGSSPGDHQMGTGYMIMSPGVDFSRRYVSFISVHVAFPNVITFLSYSIYTNSSGAHSRASSLAEDTNDGYVPSDPVQPSEEYVDMIDSNPQHPASGMSSAASSCSITSGTPSTDMRFAEYQLDKVVSRFTPDEEDTR